jgi:hypothetical protein
LSSHTPFGNSSQVETCLRMTTTNHYALLKLPGFFGESGLSAT